MSFVDALPSFKMKQWQVIVLLFVEALSVHRLPSLAPQMTSRSMLLHKVNTETSIILVFCIIFVQSACIYSIVNFACHLLTLYVVCFLSWSLSLGPQLRRNLETGNKKLYLFTDFLLKALYFKDHIDDHGAIRTALLALLFACAVFSFSFSLFSFCSPKFSCLP